MSALNQEIPTAEELVRTLKAFVDREVERNGGSTKAVKPGHRKPFHWPPHPVSYSYHVLASDWSGSAEFEAHGETFEVEVATTPYGVFGRCPKLWHEDKGDTLEHMLENLRNSSEPLFQRQMCLARCLERSGRYTGSIKELPLEDLLKLLYCVDRDIANDARIEIDTHASLNIFGPALIEVLCDRRHPNRRSAQWCVLDLFEDLTSFCPTEEMQLQAVAATKNLLWTAEDDYARTVYKAGVVLGGHLPSDVGGPVLLECLKAPSRIGRRSAIHGLFHVVEWHPESRAKVVDALNKVSMNDAEPALRHYAKDMAHDIETGGVDHIPEPVFEGEG